MQNKILFLLLILQGFFLLFPTTVKAEGAKAEGLISDHTNINDSDSHHLLQVSALLEVMAEGLLNSEQQDEVSLSTLQLAGHKDLTERISLDILFFYSAESDSLEFDTLVLNYQHEQQPEWAFSIGQDYLPFGAFSTHQLDDTLSLEVAERRDLFTAVTHQKNGFISQLYVHKLEQNSATSFGAGIVYQTDFDQSGSYLMGVDYIDSLYDRRGLSLQGQVNWQEFAMIVERLLLEHDQGNHQSLKNHTDQIELVYDAGTLLLSVSYQENHAHANIDQLALEGFELPQKKTSFTISSDLNSFTHLGLQLAQAESEESASLLLSLSM